MNISEYFFNKFRNNKQDYRDCRYIYDNNFTEIQNLIVRKFYKKPFSKKSLDRLLIQHHSVMDKILTRLSAGIIDDLPQRELWINDNQQDEQLTEILTECDYNLVLKEALKQAIFYNVILAHPIYRINDKAFDIDIITPDSFEVETQDNYLRLKTLVVEHYTPGEGFYYEYWNDAEHYKIDTMGNETGFDSNPNKINPYKIIPFETLRIKSGSDFYGEPLWDLFYDQLIIDLKLSVTDRAEFFQRWGILFGVGTKIADGTSLSPGDIIQEKFQADGNPILTYINSSVDFQGAIDSIEYRKKSALSNRGIVGASASLDDTANSGASKEIDEISLVEYRNHLKLILNKFELKLLNKIRTIWNYHIKAGDIKGKPLSEVGEFIITYQDVDNYESEEEKSKRRVDQKKYNIKNEKEFIMEDLEIDREEAIKHYNKMKKENIELGITNNIAERLIV